MKKIKVLSLFDGMSVAQQALKELDIPVEYYASEIDKYAIAVTQSNFPDTIQLGDVREITTIKYDEFVNNNTLTHPYNEKIFLGNNVFVEKSELDFLIGGSPCQDLSIAKKNREGLKGQRSGLFYEYVRIRDEVKPKYFILENVNSMPKEAKEQISEILGVEPVMINASLVSAQNRKRLFWIGRWNGEKYEQVEISKPKDKGILLKDILEDCVDEKYYLNSSAIKTLNRDSYGAKGSIADKDNKTKTLTASMGSGGGNGIYTKDTKNLKSENDKAVSMTASMHKGYGNDGVTTVRIGSLNSGGQGDRIYSQDGKSTSLSANGGGRGAKTGLYAVTRASVQKNAEQYDNGKTPALTSAMGMGGGNVPMMMDKETADNLKDKYIDGEVRKGIRKLTPTECLRLQSLPDNYFDKAIANKKPISNTQRYKMCGNAFNCEVIKHILKNTISNL
jgi:DNA (cytosine-5)-methyltransferase 3A